MKKKVLKNYIYDGFGFSIVLDEVTMVEIDGEWNPQIDVRALSKQVICSLVTQEERLTGNQIKFIRAYFKMSLRAFGNAVVSESHAAVSKWEKFENNPTNMDVNIEIMLRLYIYDHVMKMTANKKLAFYDCYSKLTKILSYQNLS